MKFKSFVVAALGIAALSHPALAHPGLPHSHSFAAGFMHPATGADHVMVMLAVGVIAAQMGGRALWAVPLSFLSVMALGGVLAMNGFVLPLAEAMIALSIFVTAALVLVKPQLSTAIGAGVVGFFAFFHGQAHGAEMPLHASGLNYALGFLAATALLHAVGMAVMIAVQKSQAMKFSSR